MIKEEIMDIDESPATEVKAEQEQKSLKSTNFKYKLIERLENASDKDLTNNLSLAITIQTMFKNDLEILERLFKFFIKKKQIDMALDLWENDLLKKFDFSTVSQFDEHLKRIAMQIIYHLSVKAMAERERNQLNKIDIDPTNEFYLQLFLKLNQQTQEKLVTQMLDKYRIGFSFLRINMADPNVKKETAPQQTIEIREFYSKLVEVKDTIFITKDLLAIYRKLIPEYGLFLIDGFLNIEKQLFTNLIQNSQADQILNNIEKRSLNIIRRICVVDLIPEFIYLIDKLDNRHCYRWIEKSLEFFTKYTLNSIEAKFEDYYKDGKPLVKLNYLNARLLNDLELSAINEDEKVFNERIEFLNENLKELIDYKYMPKTSCDESSPFENVYRLLDEIGKKLEWPALPENLKNSSFSSSDNKFIYLLNLKKEKAESKSANISISSLNKQISFYGIALFFQKLIEFNALETKFFDSNLIMSRRFDSSVKHDYLEGMKTKQVDYNFTEPIDFSICTLVYCLKLWQKFNSHKEFSTIVTKCLSNSKLDSLTFYKNFLNEYYSVYSSTLNPANNSSFTWESLDTITSIKQKINILVTLFINEKSSFKKFFTILVDIIDKLKPANDNKKTSGKIILSFYQFDIYELNLNNTIEYFSRLIIEKLHQLFANKKSALVKYLSQNDTTLGHLLMLIQINLFENVPSYVIEVYKIIIQIVKSKASFNYPQFFEHFYDIKILEDFLSMIFASNAKEIGQIWKLTTEDVKDIDLLTNKFVSQVNSDKSENRHTLLKSFYEKNVDSLSEVFEIMFK